MKHIKDKFLRHEIGNQSVVDTFNSAVPLPKEITLNSDYHSIWIKVENYLVKAFTYEIDNKTITIPEPDLVVCLFQVSRSHVVQIAELKAALISSDNNLNERLQNSLRFYATATLSITTLFNCLEAFLNRLIPAGYVYTGKIKFRNDKPWNKENIERYMGFKDKIKEVLPHLTQNTYHTAYGNNFENILKLKELRDNMTHIKAAHSENQPIYANLYIGALEFDYMASIEAAKSFINFYHPNLIEPCNCGQDY